jgi:hypothetical protein
MNLPFYPAIIKVAKCKTLKRLKEITEKKKNNIENIY